MSSNPAFGETMAEIVYSGDKPSHRHDLSWPASGEPDPPSGQIVRCICGRYFRWRYPNIDGSIESTWMPVRWWHRDAQRRIRDWRDHHRLGGRPGR